MATLLNYSASVLTDSGSLYLWWRLNDPVSSSVATDSSGNGRHGSYFGTDLSWQSGSCNNNPITDWSVRFNPTATSDAGIILNPVPADFPSSSLTFEWIQRDSTTNSGDTLFSYAVSGSNDEFRFTEDGTTQVRVYVTGSNVTLNASGAVAPGEGSARNVHYALTWQASNGMATIFKNGRQVNSGVVGAGHLLLSGGSLVLCQDQDSPGGGYSTAESYRVTLMEVAIYSGVLPSERIRAHANAAIPSYYDYNIREINRVGYTNDAEDDISFFATTKLELYFQRIWDLDNSVWCYYTSPVINPNPAPSETNPPHSGNFYNHQIVKVFNNID